MRPSRKGWVSHYAELIKQQSQKSTFLEDIKSDFSSLNRGKKIYKLVQPTGLMYGHPIKAPGNFDISMSNWNDKEKMKFILFNGFIYNTLLNHSGDIGNETDMDECLRGAINAISNFYKEFIFTPSNSTIRKWKKYNDFELIEIMINKRLEVLSNWINSFWTSFFQNSLLFLDIYYFDLWLSKNEAFTDIEEFRKQQENLRIQILKVMAAAARSDSVIEAEEKALFNFFLKSSKLQIDNQKKQWTFCILILD